MADRPTLRFFAPGEEPTRSPSKSSDEDPLEIFTMTMDEAVERYAPPPFDPTPWRDSD